MEVNAGKSQTAAGRGRRRGRSEPPGHGWGGRQPGVLPEPAGWVSARFVSATGSVPVLPLAAPRSPSRFPASPQRGSAAPARPPPHMARPREPRARCVYVRRRAGAGWLDGRVTRHYIMGAEAVAAGGDT